VKYLGIDYGAKRVGIAVSNEEGSIAFPRATISSDKALEVIQDVIREEKVESIVVGDTRSHGDRENPITKEAEQFMGELAQETGLPVSRAFEVFSSIEASRHAPKGKEHDDSAAAALILQRFLDMNASR